MGGSIIRDMPVDFDQLMPLEATQTALEFEASEYSGPSVDGQANEETSSATKLLPNLLDFSGIG